MRDGVRGTGSCEKIHFGTGVSLRFSAARPFLELTEHLGRRTPGQENAASRPDTRWGGFSRPVVGRWGSHQPVGISSGASWNMRCRLNANAAQQASHFTFAKPLVENRRNLNFVLIQALGNSTNGARCL